MISRFSADGKLEFEVLPPIYRPFYNEWGANAYSTYSPFDMDPFTLRASSTSGSPVLIAHRAFFGFMNESGGSFAYDGCGKLTVTGKAGQELWYNECCDPYEEWEKYNEAIISGREPHADERFWSGIEYCTWVDQKNLAAQRGLRDVHEPLCEDYVYEYMRRVEKLGLPKGKLTIDDGWDVRYAPDGRMCYGNWETDRRKFPHMERLVRDMTESGFIPGLWFAPFTFTPNSELAKTHPELIGDTFSQNAEAEAVRRLMFIKPSPVLEEYYRKIFHYYIDMGFRKFKLDMSYGYKHEMKQLLSMMYRIIKEKEPSVEVEAHIPDIFVSRYCDTVRINDVSFDEQDRWRAVTMEHYKVCRWSAAGRILNLDHLGTNTPVPDGDRYLEHTRMLTHLSGGYPCVSLLPDVFGKKVSDAFTGMVRDWHAENCR